jgi:nitronate monooxygenase
MALRTPLTDRLGLRYPVLGAPIGRGATPTYVGALERAGALGFVALAHVPKVEVRQFLSDYLTFAGDGCRFGINLTLTEDQTARLEAALEVGCRVVSLWHGDPASYVRRAKDAGAVVFWTVGAPSEAARAADLGVDFLVCQGREAGGHLVGSAPLIALLPAVADAARGVPVVAAGGIADGRGLAAALCLGGCGIWMGTRFVSSLESGSHPGYKRRIANAESTDLAETTLFDGGWKDAPHRVIRNETFEMWERAGRPPSGARPGEGEAVAKFPDGRTMLRYDSASPWAGMDGYWGATALYAGASVALVREIEPIAEILMHVEQQAETTLDQQNARRI